MTHIEHSDSEKNTSHQRIYYGVLRFLKIVVGIAVVVLLFGLLTACNGTNDQTGNSNQPILVTTANTETSHHTTDNQSELDSGTTVSETSATTLPVDRYQKAILDAISIAEKLFPTERKQVKAALLNPSTEDSFDPYSEDEANYAIANANINWKDHLVALFNSYLELDCTYYLRVNMAPDCVVYPVCFTDEEIEYALKNCKADWAEQAYKYVTWMYQARANTIFYSFCYECGKIYGQYDYCPFCGVRIGIRNAFGYTKDELVLKLMEDGFTSSEIDSALSRVSDSIYYNENDYRKADAIGENNSDTTQQTTASTTAITSATQTVLGEDGTKVWISDSGSRYHSKSSCSNMKNPSQITKSEAKSRGYEPCGRCY